MQIKKSKLKGFYEIPHFKNYYINRIGTVYSVRRKAILAGCKNPNGYHFYHITNDDGKNIVTGRHRLMGLAFKYPGKHYGSLYVNHIDGIKGRDVLSNLEWVTPRENVIHAGENNLTEKCKPIEVLELDESRVRYFPSYKEAGEFYGMSKDAIAHRMKSPSNCLWPEGNLYRKRTGSEWDVNNLVSKEGASKRVVSKNHLTGIITHHRSLTDASDKTGINQANLSKLLKSDFYLSNNFYTYKLLSDKRTMPEYDDPYMEYSKRGTRVVIVVVDGNNRSIYTCGRRVCEEYNIKPSALSYRLKSENKGKIGFYHYKDFVQEYGRL